jgi:acetyl esterase
VTDDTVAGVPVRRYLPKGAKPGQIAFFHCGGWMLGSIESHDYLAATIATQSGHEVVSVEYRLAPDPPFPAGLDHCMTVTRALAATGKVAVAGDSAGGNLAAAVANEVPVLAQFLMYPVTDSATETPSHDHFATGHLLIRATMRHFRESNAADPLTRASARVSPLRNPDFSHSAPAFISVAQCDILRDEGAAYADHLREAGVEVTFEEVAGTLHGFASLLGLHEARATLQEGSNWLASKLT